MTEMSLNEYNARSKPESEKRPTVPRTGIVATGFVLVAVISFISFFGGIQYQKGQKAAATQTSSSSSYGQSNSSGSFRGGFQRSGRVVGIVGSVSSSSITVQGRSGSSNTYTITSSTTVSNNGQTASLSDIQTGDTVFMTLDSSNTQDVSSIMLNPGFGGFGPGAGSSGAQTSPDASGTSATGA